MLIVGRAVAGLGASGIINGAFTIISVSVPLEKRPPLIGVCMGISQLGQVIGPLVGGAFTTGYTWRWSFYINLPLGALVAIPLTILRVPEQMPKDKAWSVIRKIHQRVDLVGFALFAPAVIMLLLALEYGGNQFSWNSSVVIGLFIGAGANGIVWGIWNWHKGEAALIPASMVKRRIVAISALNYGLFMALVFGAVYYLPIYFQAIKEASAVLSGVYLLPNIIPQVITTILTGVLGKSNRRLRPLRREMLMYGVYLQSRGLVACLHSPFSLRVLPPSAAACTVRLGRRPAQENGSATKSLLELGKALVFKW